MKIIKGLPFTILILLIASSLACRLFTGSEQIEAEQATAQTQSEAQAPAPPTLTPVESQSTRIEEPSPLTYDTEFPLPGDVQNLIKQDDGSINFQTNRSLDENIFFYRESFEAQGLSERQLLTNIEAETFSIVFDGAPNGSAIVVQGVLLSPELVNINIRYEDF
jgi:hypothetical protein